ncbi:MAG: hypothetical protein GY861_19550 [bacterium]|nr:hypothetical protein [bacterium]
MKRLTGTVKKFYSSNKILSLLFIALFVLLSIFFAKTVLAAIQLVVLFFIASFSTAYRSKIGMPFIGVELVTFCTVLVSISYNPVIGILFGISTALASEIIAKSIGLSAWLYAIAMGVVGAFVGNFAHLPILVVGMGATIFKLVISQSFHFVVGDMEMKSVSIFYIITSLIFNFIMFLSMGAKVLNLLI